MTGFGSRPKPAPSRPPDAGQADGMTLWVAWYAASEWPKVKAAAADAERFDDSFAEWERNAEAALAELRAQKFALRAEELLAWCLAHGRPNDAAARSAFVVERGRAAQAAGG